jgi:hypothetical protein
MLLPCHVIPKPSVFLHRHASGIVWSHWIGVCLPVTTVHFLGMRVWIITSTYHARRLPIREHSLVVNAVQRIVDDRNMTAATSGRLSYFLIYFYSNHLAIGIFLLIAYALHKEVTARKSKVCELQ